jgi:type IV pilus assembly protein PilQ
LRLLLLFLMIFSLHLSESYAAGKKISLNFQDIQLRAVLQLFADFTEINLVVSDRVTGNITLRLNDVPWDEALDIILTTQGLDKREVGNVILIDTANGRITREKNAVQELEAAKKLTPIHSSLLQINYAKAVEIATMLKDKENTLLSERGMLSADARTNTIWLQDTEDRLRDIQSLIKRLDVPVKQVIIEARIVNVTKNCARDLGVRWGVSKPPQLSGTLVGATAVAEGKTIGEVPSGERLNLDLGAIPLDASPASVGIALAKLGGGVLLDLELSALESEGRAEIVASPELMTTNQQPAMIESGEDIPYQESTLGGGTAVAFKKAVLRLKVTPQITPNGKLLMDLQINQDSDSGRRVQGVPIILTKSIQTNVLVSNGETIVLGGIYQQDKNNAVSRVPFLGRIPMLGYLFSRKQIRLKNEELLIFITPRIIASGSSKIVEQ